MKCPKCNQNSILGFQDGTLKCTECTWIGRERPTPPAVVWQGGLREYLNTLSIEEASNKDMIVQIVGHLYLSHDTTPPPAKEVVKFLDEYLSARNNEQK